MMDTQQTNSIYKAEEVKEPLESTKTSPVKTRLPLSQARRNPTREKRKKESYAASKAKKELITEQKRNT